MLIRNALTKDIDDINEIYNYEVLKGVATFDTEEKLYNFLKLNYIQPQFRTGEKEIEQAQKCYNEKVQNNPAPRRRGKPRYNRKRKRRKNEQSSGVFCRRNRGVRGAFGRGYAAPRAR